MTATAIPSRMTARQYQAFLSSGQVPPAEAAQAPARPSQPVPQAPAKVRLPAPGCSYDTEGMNKTEAAYALHLEAERHMGRVLCWKFEPLGLRLARKTFYHPDFLVVLADGATEYHETKGFMQDDANVKLKAAATLFPFWVFRLVKRKGREWMITEVLR